MIPGGVNPKTTEGLEGMRLWKLVDYTDKELKDELERREEAEELHESTRFKQVLAKIDVNAKNVGHYQCLIDVTDAPSAWCEDHQEWFDL